MIRTNVVFLACLGLFCTPLAAQVAEKPVVTADSLRRLTDTDLLKTYEITALAAGASDAPLAQGNPAKNDAATEQVAGEILHRGGRLLPALVRMLREEIILERPGPAPFAPQPSLVGLEIELLADMDDPQVVPALLDLLELHQPKTRLGTFEDFHGRVFTALEQLTFTSFRQSERENMVRHQNALPVSWYSGDDFPKAAKLYRDWLAGEGKDPAQWLPLAQKRARTLLESDDLDVVQRGAEFLTGTHGRQFAPNEDAPDRTLKRLGQIINGATHVPGDPNAYLFQGKRIAIFGWTGYLTSYGPRARPWVPSLLRIQRETGRMDIALEQMMRVGGRETMAFFIETLPTYSKQVEAIQKDPATPKGFLSGDPRLTTITLLSYCQYGIDRWAGRRFDTDDQRLAWWQANKDKTPEQWLRDSLPFAAQRADAGNNNDTPFFRQLIPDVPFGTDETMGSHLNRVPGTMPAPFRQKWLAQHRDELAYDPNTGTFRLPHRSAGP